MPEILVSIVMPAYNAAPYIAAAIDSALTQSEGRLEVLVVDDHSTDATVEIVRRISDARVRLLINEENRGPSHSRNRALDAARGTWVTFLDADDWYAPDRLERLVAMAEREDADLVGDNLWLQNDGDSAPWGTNLDAKRVSLPPVSHQSLESYLQMGIGMQPLIRRALLEKHRLRFDEELRHGEDNLLWTECLLHGARLVLTTTPYYYYRQHAGSLVRDQLTAYEQAVVTSERLLRHPSIRQHGAAVRVLQQRVRKFRRLSAYARVTTPLKQRRFGHALVAMFRNPAFLLVLLQYMPQRLRLRWAQQRSRLVGTRSPGGAGRG